MEKWKQVPGYEGFYDVSNEGHVRRVGRNVTCPRNGHTHMRYIRARDLSICQIRGYPVVRLSKHGSVKTFYVHRLVASAFIGPRPNGLAINHIDGNKRNNRPSNLEYTTSAVNNQHAYDVCGKGAKIRRGERHYWSKLDANQVRKIRAMRAEGRTLHAIADAFGICIQHVSTIAHRRTWAHI